MRPQINRLAADNAGSFSGSAIDRGKPVQFRLNGRLIAGFEGDTVLSAAIASGVDTVGTFDDSPMGLTPNTHISIAAAGSLASTSQALPMARTPAINGADFVTLGTHSANPLVRLFQPGRTLGLALDETARGEDPWRSASGSQVLETDFAIIGGGVAGMAAALWAAKNGQSVTLIEASAHLGGASGLFGTQDGEDAPETEIARLGAAIAAETAITVLNSSQAFALGPGLVRLHQITIDKDVPVGTVLDLRTRFVILTTGAQERLPIIHGNRLPGVMSTLESYILASHYGVWPGATALVSTDSNIAYRLAMLASDAGIAVQRILDSRAHPSSRFIEFTRAYGMIQVPGAGLNLINHTKSQGRLAAHINQTNAEPILTERIILCGGWQPDLALWHAAGGASVWSSAHHRLEAKGTIENIRLAGSAAGYLTRRGSMDSGREAVNLLLGRASKAFADPVIDSVYETPDAPASLGPSRADGAPAFLDSQSYLTRLPPPPPNFWQKMLGPRATQADPGISVSDQHALSTNEIAACVGLGALPADVAGIVAQERAARITLAGPKTAVGSGHEREQSLETIQPYLHDRFGSNAGLVEIVASEARRLESGALLYSSADNHSPVQAIGVVLRTIDATTLAFANSDWLQPGRTLWVRDQDRSIEVHTRNSADRT